MNTDIDKSLYGIMNCWVKKLKNIDKLETIGYTQKLYTKIRNSGFIFLQNIFHMKNNNAISETVILPRTHILSFLI